MADCPKCGKRLKEKQAIGTDSMETYLECRRCDIKYDKKKVQNVGVKFEGQIPIDTTRR